MRLAPRPVATATAEVTAAAVASAVLRLAEAWRHEGRRPGEEQSGTER